MLYCVDCDYLKKLQKVTKCNICKNYLCEYANCLLSNEDIENLTDHPCKDKDNRATRK